MHDSCPYVKYRFKDIADEIISVYFVFRRISYFAWPRHDIITRVVRCVYKNYFLFFLQNQSRQIDF